MLVVGRQQPAVLDVGQLIINVQSRVDQRAGGAGVERARMQHQRLDVAADARRGSQHVGRVAVEP
jgi:hypothetical protein